MPLPIYESDLHRDAPRGNPLRLPGKEVPVSVDQPAVLDQMMQWALTGAPQFALLVHPDVDLDRLSPMTKPILAHRMPHLVHPDGHDLFGHATPKGGFSLVQIGGGTITPVYAKSLNRTNPRALAGIPRRVILPAYEAALDTTAPAAPTVEATQPAVDPGRVDALTAEIAALTARVSAAEKSLREARREAARLHRELVAATQIVPDASTAAAEPAPGPAPVDAEAVPDPAEAWDRGSPGEAVTLASTHLPNIVILPSVDTTRLDREAKAGNWGDRAWAILATLNAYANDPNRGAFYDWLRAHPNPRIAPNAFSLTESDTVTGSGKFRDARTFPIPTHIHPDGKVFMQAHARVDAGGRGLAPRLYFYDATNTDGKVYIGYLGPHLPNTKTT